MVIQSNISNDYLVILIGIFNKIKELSTTSPIKK
jgi:hypothetical protein